MSVPLRLRILTFNILNPDWAGDDHPGWESRKRAVAKTMIVVCLGAALAVLVPTRLGAMELAVDVRRFVFLLAVGMPLGVGPVVEDGAVGRFDNSLTEFA